MAQQRAGARQDDPSHLRDQQRRGRSARRASEQAVGKWRRRFLERGVEGLHDELRPGRSRTYNDERVAGLINRALHECPQGATHWSTRTLGQAEGVSQSTVSR